MPQSVYATTMGYLGRYLSARNAGNSSMSVQGRPGVNLDGQIVFTLLVGSQSHTVAVRTSDFGSGALSTSVSIDGQEQDLHVPAISNGTTFSGIDSLIEVGVTAYQANALQQGFQKFAPSASGIAIDSGSIISPPADPNNTTLTNTYTFSVSVDGNKYDAKIKCVDLDQLELLLSDPKTHKQVFDSGLLSQP